MSLCNGPQARTSLGIIACLVVNAYSILIRSANWRDILKPAANSTDAPPQCLEQRRLQGRK